MDSLLAQIVIGVLVLGVLVFVHELGHFLFAKLCRVGVLEFSIGFGKILWAKRFGDTRYSIRVIPLGGFVRMVGDDPREVYQAGESEEKEEKGFSIEPVEDLPPEMESLLKDKSRWLLEKGFPAKAAIVLAGPLFNLLFGWLLAFLAFWSFGISEPVDQPLIGTVLGGFPAEEADIRAEDRIVSIDGTELNSWKDLASTVRNSDGKEMLFTIERKEAGEVKRFDQAIVGQQESIEMALLNDSSGKRAFIIGISPMLEEQEVAFTDALIYAGYHVYGTCSLTIKSFALLIRGKISPKHIGGPITIVKEAAGSAQKGIERLMGFMIFLSVSLAILNLLPVPILDGGHLVFFLIELVKGGPVSLRLHEIANQVGLVLLLALMLFAVGNDIVRLFAGNG